MEYLVKAGLSDEPGEVIPRGRPRFAFMVPPGCPPGMSASIEIDGKTRELNSGQAPARGATRGRGRAASSWQPTARDREFAAQLIEDGYLPIPMTSRHPGRRGVQPESVYGYLKFFINPDEMSPDEDEVRDEAKSSARAASCSSSSSAAAAPEKRPPQAASASVATGEESRLSVQTSVVTPHDFPPDLAIRLQIGDQVVDVTPSPDSRWVASGAATGVGQGRASSPLDGKMIAQLKAEGYAPVTVQMPLAPPA